MTRINPVQAMRETGRRKTLLAAACAAAVALGTAGSAHAQQLDSAVTQQEQIDADAAKSQTAINALGDRAIEASTRYAQALADAESLEKYNRQLEEQVASQEAEMASIEAQLSEIDTTNRELQPLMEQMVDGLEQFVSLDVPFLLKERTERVATLKDLLGRADVAVSEKYRRILEAYQIELEYGRTLEAYQGVLEDGRTVDFARLGRVALMYRTLDGSETGYWDNKQKAWVVDNSYSDEVERALRVAKQEVAPELLVVPVPAPEEVRS